MRKIAIIGATSFLASYFLEAFKGEHLTLYGRHDPLHLPPPAYSHLHWTYPHTKHRFKRWVFPTHPLDQESLLAADVILYCAAAGVQASDKHTEETISQVNALIPIKLLAFLEENNFRGKAIFFGSYFEIGNSEAEHFFTEEEVLTSTREVPNSYCSTKRLLSQYIGQSGHQVKAWHLILPSIYGSHEDEKRLIPYLVRSLAAGEAVQLSSGQQVRQYLHCTDVVRLVKLLIGGEYEPGVFNVANKEAVKISDLVQRIFDLFGQDATSSLGTKQTPGRDEGMKVLLLSPDKLAAAVPEWSPSITLEQGLAEYLPEYAVKD